ncbi:MAG: hydrogenase formation protein HypD, partial [Bacillota bacterium]|nr:hydrogenase formation protein HypD [Bacillota bacterium]
DIAQQNPARQLVFFGVGFETTAPLTAATLRRGKELGLKNFYVLSAHKTMPQVLKTLLPGSKVDALLCPGHVASITGEELFSFVPRELSLPAVISGFEPVDILEAILALLRMKNDSCAKLQNCYPRVVRRQGNAFALSMMNEVFSPCDSTWRGLGRIPDSGLALREEYREFDASQRFAAEIAAGKSYQDHPGCRCGAVLRGEMEAKSCPLFGRICTPLNPCGACMVSAEGACAAAYKYGRM